LTARRFPPPFGACPRSCALFESRDFSVEGFRTLR
jgi:hypothetical protein